MNTNLKKLAGYQRSGRLAVNLILIVLAVVCLIAFVSTQNAGRDSGAVPYTESSKAGDTVYVEAQYISEYFAQFEAEESDKLYFVLDQDFGAYVVCIPDTEMEAYDDVMKYTFGEVNTAPQTVRTVGKLVPFEDELVELAVEGFNWFWEDGAVSEATFTDVFGEYYIDTALEDVSGTPYLLLGAAVALVAAAIILVRKNQGIETTSRMTMTRIGAGAEAERIDAELQDSRTVHLQKLGVYLTEHYLIRYTKGLKVTDLGQLAGLYGTVKGNEIALICRDTAADETEMVAVNGGNKGQMDEFARLVSMISLNAPGLEYGAERIRMETEVDIRQVDGFFVQKNEASHLEIQHEMTGADGTIVAPNVGLGILCALGGALIGGLVWFLIGSVGYIAGIVGFLILYLSAMGFKLGAKVMTKGGAVLAVIITLLTILAANYLLYSWQLTQAYEGRFTFVECIGKLPDLLKTEPDVMGGFVKDILVGYVFTAMAGFSTLRTMFGKKK